MWMASSINLSRLACVQIIAKVYDVFCAIFIILSVFKLLSLLIFYIIFDYLSYSKY
jgi:hypothetical protein